METWNFVSVFSLTPLYARIIIIMYTRSKRKESIPYILTSKCFPVPKKKIAIRQGVFWYCTKLWNYSTRIPKFDIIFASKFYLRTPKGKSSVKCFRNYEYLKFGICNVKFPVGRYITHCIVYNSISITEILLEGIICNFRFVYFKFLEIGFG